MHDRNLELHRDQSCQWHGVLDHGGRNEQRWCVAGIDGRVWYADARTHRTGGSHIGGRDARQRVTNGVVDGGGGRRFAADRLYRVRH